MKKRGLLTRLKFSMLSVLLVMACLYSETGLHGQNVTLTSTATGTTFWSATGGALTFAINNANATSIHLKALSTYMPANHSSTYTLWYHPTSLTGVPPDITTGNGWVQVATVPVTGPGTAGVAPVFSGLTFLIPAGATYRFALQATANGPYYGTANNSPATISNGNINLYSQDNPLSPSYAGPFPGPVSNTPRGFYGTLDFEILAGGPDDASISQLVSPAGNFCAGTQNVSVLLQNAGNNIINDVIINWELNGVLQTPVNWNTPVDTIGSVGGNTATVSLGNIAFSSTPQTFKVWTSLPNGVADTSNLNDTLTFALQSSLNGVYTIGGSSPDYTTIAAAVSALNTYGVCGPVTFNIRPGTYNEQITMNTVAGASAVNRITFQSENNAASSVNVTHAATAAANNFVFTLNGASYITIKNISITPAGTSFGHGVVFAGAASNDSIVNCIIDMPSVTTSNSGGIYGVSLTGGFNVLKGNTISDGYYGIYYKGTSATVLAPDVVIEDNAVSTPYYYGIYVYQTERAAVRRNTVTTGAPGSTTWYGIYLYYSDDLVDVVDNTVNTTGGSVAHGLFLSYCDMPNIATIISGNRLTGNGSTGVSYALTFNYCNYAAGAIPAIVKNNVAYMSGTGNSQALRVYYSGSLRIYNNTCVNAGSGTTSYGAYMYCTSATYTDVIAWNNAFAHLAGGRPLYVYNPLWSATDYNNLYTTGTNLVQRGTPAGNFTSLTAWRQNSGQDMNSVFYDPGFTSATNFVPNPANANSWSLNGRGIQVAGNNTDINGNSRPDVLTAGVPDIGAYEFTPSVIPPASLANPVAPAPNTTQVFTFGQDTVAVINWGATVPATFPVRQYTGTVPPNLASTADSLFFYDDFDAVAGVYDYQASIYYKDAWLGTLQESTMKLSKKDGVAPWVTLSAAQSITDPTFNHMTAPGLTALPSLFTGIGEACMGQPLATLISTPPLSNSKCVGDSVQISATDPNGADGISYQWEQAASLSGPFTNVTGGTGATTLNYESSVLNSDTYYRMRVTCSNGGAFSYSDTFTVIVVNPMVLSTTPGTHCGPGTVTLQATASPGVTLNWYDAPSGGNLLGTGASFITPLLTATTSYYVNASSGSAPAFVGPVSPASVGSGGYFNYDTYKTYFTVNNAVTIASVDIFASATGVSSAINILSEPSGTVVATVPYTTTTSGSTTVPQTVMMNISLPPGAYSMKMADNAVSLYRNDAGAVFPYSLPNISITGHSFAGYPAYYYYFYNWQVGIGCESPTTQVDAIITPSPSIVPTATDTIICTGASTTLNVTSANPGYSYDWTPGNLNGALQNVSPLSSTDYIVTANDNSGGPNDGCVSIDTLSIQVNEIQLLGINASATTVCSGSQLDLEASANTIIGGTATIGAGASTTATGTGVPAQISPFLHYNGGVKSQYLITASELQASGLTAGTLTSLGLTVVGSDNVPLTDFTIDMANTLSAALTTTFINSGFTAVYANDTILPTPGVNTYNFTAPFIWDGTSNVVIQMSWSRGDAGAGSTAHTVLFDNTPYVSNAFYRVNNLPASIVYSTATATNTNSGRPQFIIGATGAGSYDWSWNPGSIQGNSISTFPVNTGSTPATETYVVTVMDNASGCILSDSIDIVVNPQPSLNLGADTTICVNGSAFFLDATAGGSGFFYQWQDGSVTPTFLVSSPGTYSVQITDGSGCTAADTIVVTQVNPVQVAIDVDFTGPSTAVLDAGSGFTGFVWSNLQTTQTITVTNNGVYTVTATDANGCTSSISTTIVFTVGINEDGSTSTISYYPNPSDGNFAIDVKSFKAGDMRIEVMDIHGRMVYSTNIANAPEDFVQPMNLSDAAPGTYIVRVTSSIGSHTGRIIIK